MAPTTCGICGAATDTYLCDDDTHTLRVDLLRTPSLLAELRVTHTRGDVRGTGDGPRAPHGPAPLPFNEAAGLLLRQLDRHLRTYKAGDADLATLTPERLALRRAKATDVIRLHPTAPHYAQELHRLLARVPGIVDCRATLWNYGPCHCGQPLHEAPDASTVTCTACNHTHDATVLKERQWQAAAQALVTQAEAAQWIVIRYDLDPRRADRIRQNINLWVHRGRVELKGGYVSFGDVDAQWRKNAMRAKKAARNAQPTRQTADSTA